MKKQICKQRGKEEQINKTHTQRRMIKEADKQTRKEEIR